MGETLTFTATGSPQVVSRAIEEYARTQGHVTAIVVPWESDATTLRMAVTAVKSDGWAIEHTNLGTIRLVDAGQERTEVAIAAEPPDHPEPQKLAAVFERFASFEQDMSISLYRDAPNGAARKPGALQFSQRGFAGGAVYPSHIYG